MPFIAAHKPQLKESTAKAVKGNHVHISNTFRMHNPKNLKEKNEIQGNQIDKSIYYDSKFSRLLAKFALLIKED